MTERNLPPNLGFSPYIAARVKGLSRTSSASDLAAGCGGVRGAAGAAGTWFRAVSTGSNREMRTNHLGMSDQQCAMTPPLYLFVSVLRPPFAAVFHLGSSVYG